jgi:hypothetical protein
MQRLTTLAASDPETQPEQTQETADEERQQTKLPSFKKRVRERDDEENARLEEVRREIRQLKNTSPKPHVSFEQQEEDDTPMDPREGERKDICAPPKLAITPL